MHGNELPDDQHSCTGSTGSEPASLGVVRTSVPARSGRGRESIDPDKMKLCTGYHNPFASTVTSSADIYSGFW